MKKKLIMASITLLGLLTLAGCGSNSLKGNYTAKVSLFIMESTDTLKFEGNKVTEINGDGKETNKGTYKISDDEIELKLGDYNMTAELSKDKKSFVIKSADGLAGLAKGAKYIKEEK